MEPIDNADLAREVTEQEAFEDLQSRLPGIYRTVFSDSKAPRTIVVVPSMSLDERELNKIQGVIHYEERMLCLLMLLRLPYTQLIYITSVPVDPAIIDYYLHLLPGIPGLHARRRLKLLSARDPSLKPLSQKILERPELLLEIRRSIAYPGAAHISCFNTTTLERSLALALDIPIYANDPEKSELGSKSEARRLFRDLGIDVPVGFEDLRDRTDVIDAIVELHRLNPSLENAVVKLNHGFSGEGNALIAMNGIEGAPAPRRAAADALARARFEAAGETWDSYEEKLNEMGGIVESFIGGNTKESPSVQVRINPMNEVEVISTHDQVLGGPNGQVFEGCTFPARKRYRSDLHGIGRAVGAALKDRGVLGRFGVDFVSVPEDKGWRHFAIEINLRKGGTTLPYLMLQFLTDGRYDEETGRFLTQNETSRAYYATDNLVSDDYLGLTPGRLIDIAVENDLHFDAATQSGLVFHLLGAATEHGKIGMVSIAPKRGEAWKQHQRAVATLNSVAAGEPATRSDQRTVAAISESGDRTERSSAM